ncbi:MAG: TGS domain-containing protein [bacterium]|nr:TGS domain-containing protein [bacterium]
MPTNLPLQYHKAEERFKAATDINEKIAHLRDMMAIMPHHKATNKIRGELRKKLSALNEQLETSKKSKKGGPNPWFVPHGETPQVLLVGAPNCGKSSLLDTLTNAEPVVAEYPFSTTLPQPGIMTWEDVNIELVDTPPIMQVPLEHWILDQARAADAVLLVADLGAPDCCEAVEMIAGGFEERGLRLVSEVNPEDEFSAHNERRTMLIANKADHPDAPVNLEFITELVGGRWPRVVISCGEEQGLEGFAHSVFDLLQLVRVYTKVPGKPPDMKAPYLVPIGATVLDVAGKVHRDFLQSFASAKIWGSGKFDGQTVERGHVVRDGDILEIHTR